MAPAHMIGNVRIALGMLALAFAAPVAAQQVVKTVATAANPTQIVVNPVSNKWFAALGAGGWAMGDGTSGAVTTFTSFGDVIKFGAVNPVTNRVYFVRNDTALMAVDATSGTNFPTLNLGKAIDAIVVNPVTGFYYILHKAADEVTWFDADNSGSISTVTKPAVGAVDGATNTIYFASDAIDATLTKMSGSTHQPTGSTVMSLPATAMAANPATGKVYVATAGTSLLVFDGGTLVEAAPVTVCSAATAVAVNPATNRLYVLCPGADAVTVVDGATDTVAGTVTVGDAPGAISIDVVANRIYVADQADGTVTVIDGVTHATQMVTVGTAPGSIAVNPVTGKVFVANAGSSDVSVIDRSTWTQTAGPNGSVAAVNPITGKAYVANFFAGNTLTILDAAGSTLGTPAVGFSAMAIAIDPLLDKVFVTLQGGGVAVVDGPTNALVTTIPVASPTAIGLNPVNQRAYVAIASLNTLVVIDTPTNTTITGLSTGTSPRAVAVNAQTNRVFVANADSGTVSVFEGGTNVTPPTLVKHIATGTQPVAVAVNAVTNRIYVANNSSTVSEIVGSTIDDASPTVVQHTAAGNVNDVAVNERTNRVYFSAVNSNDAFVLDPDAALVTPIPVGGNSDNVAVDPVRDKVYIARNTGASVAIVDGATLAVNVIGVGSNPVRPAVNPVSGRFYVARAGTAIAIVDPAPGTFIHHQPAVTMAVGIVTSNTAPSLSVTTHALYSPADPPVQRVHYRTGDSLGGHANATGSGPYVASLSGLTKGLNYVSLFAIDAMAGSSVASESGAAGASSTIVGAPQVFAFVLVDPPRITTPSLPGGRVGISYFNGIAAVGGVGARTFAITSGALPTGLSLLSNGNFSGAAPTATGTFNFTVTVTDASGGTDDKPLSITVVGPPDVPTGLVATPGNGQATFDFLAPVNDGGSPIIGYNVVCTPGPISTGGSALQHVLTGLTNGVEYTCTAHAVNTWGQSPDTPPVTVTPFQPTFTLTVARTGTGNGTVTSSPAGINCGATCATAFNEGASITLTATPSAGSAFAQWTNCDSPAANQCTVSLTAAKTVTANFVALVTYTLVLEGYQQAAPYVATPATGGGTAVYNAFNRQLTFNLAYSGLTGTETAAHIHGPGPRGVNGPVIINLAAGSPKTQTVTLTAGQEVFLLAGELYVNVHTTTFPNGEIRAQIDNVGARVTRALSVTKAGTGSGTVIGFSDPGQVITCGSDCSETIPNGFTAVLYQTPAPGSTFAGWSGACVGGPTAACNLTMDAAKVVTATYTQVTHTITVVKDGSGTVTSSPAGINCGATCSAQFNAATDVTLTATPASGFEFVAWAHSCSGTSTSCILTVDGAHTARAIFQSLGSDVGTTITAAPSTAAVGEDVTFTLTVTSAGPEPGVGVAAWAFIPAGATFVSASAGCTQGTLGPNPIVSCIPDSVAIGATPQYTFVLRPTAVGTLTVNADVSSSKPDPVAGNNESSVSVTVVDPPRLGNISTRMQVLTGNDVMIGGFVIGGSGNKTVVVRARGPSLIPFGITNALANPTLQLVRSSDQVTLATNDDWQSAANAADLTASGFAPADNLEAAILTNLPPGAYTAIVSGVANGTGVGIVEVFEVDGTLVPLANISTRGQVLSGNDVMIGGFVIQGTGAQTVVIRARGPSLIPFGITNALANPQLQLVRASDQVQVAFSDDWESASNAADITASGFAPSDSLEAAILVTLPPGAYTAIVTGVGGGTGVAIVEVFAN